MRPASVIVLDPGHGGHRDVGGSTANRAVAPDGTLEKDLVLDLAQRVELNLNGWGGRTWLTRRTDVNPGLRERAALSQRVEADAFVSIHLGQRPGQGTLTAIHEQAAPRSAALARLVHTELLRVTGLPDLGVQRLPLAVLHPERHRERAAAVLVEASVLSDAVEAGRLRSPAYRSAIAGAIGSAIRRWSHLETSRPPAVTHAGRAVVVGVETYDGADPVPFAHRDAQSLATSLQQGFGFHPASVTLLEDPTMADIASALRTAGRGMPESQPLCLAFAGRGSCGPQGEPVLVAADGVRFGRSALAGLVGRPLTVLADAGHAIAPTSEGRSMGWDRTRPWPGPRTEAAGIRWLGAASPGGEAYTHTGSGHGLFTAALAERTRQPVEISHQGLTTRLQEDISELLLRCAIVGRQRPHASTHRQDVVFLTPGPRTSPASLVPIRHHVPLVPQSSEMSCWAAAGAMIVGWRERIALDDDELARIAGQLQAYRDGLLPRDVDTMAAHWSLTSTELHTCSVAQVHQLLQTHGPLWLGEADPDLHVVVVCGMRGDGTPDGTDVEIADPWPIDRGERYSLSFRELMENVTNARSLAGPHVQVMHTGGRPSYRDPLVSRGY